MSRGDRVYWKRAIGLSALEEERRRELWVAGLGHWLAGTICPPSGPVALNGSHSQDAPYARALWNKTKLVLSPCGHSIDYHLFIPTLPHR